MINNVINRKMFFILLLPVFFTNCKKLVEIAPPVSSITLTQVFDRNDQALAAMSGLYSDMINNTDNINKFCNGALSIYTGTSADESKFFFQVDVRNEFQSNNLTALNGLVDQYYWSSAYSLIYRANAIIEGLSASKGVSNDVKVELTGEAKFIRALCHFYLVNLFGNVPIVTSTNYHKTATLARAPIDDVYMQIIEDLKDSQAKLKNDFSAGNGERIIPNRAAATALLARVYLYNDDWANAEEQSNNIINSNLFQLPKDLDSVFLKNNSEAIWQLKQNNTSGSMNATPEGFNVVPFDAFSPPIIYLTNELLNSFEPGDNRRSKWIDSIDFLSIKYYYPYKYKIGPAQAFSGPYNEYYMVLRLAEQYLIRAEARAHENNLSGAIADLNIIRSRAGLPNLSSSLTPSQIFSAIEQENRIEFFAEWGHRWLDLKRWKRADTVLSPIKGSYWQSTDKLYPIPQYEINTGSNMSQNDGY